MSVEREAKLVAPADFDLPELQEIDGDLHVAPPVTTNLDAVYFDTDDLALARAGATARHRTGEAGPPWTLKLPGSDKGSTLAREELVFDGDADTVPPDLADLVVALVRGRSLAPVVQLRTERTTLVVRDAAGDAVVELVDDRVKAFKDTRLSVFREIEIEVRREGRTAERALGTIVRLLTECGCRAERPMPKAVRALGAAATEAPDVVVPKLGRKATIAELAHYAIAGSVAQIVRHDPGVRLGDDAEDVHRFRVGTRRLRSDLRTFRGVLDREWVEQLRAELKWLGGEIGRVRDDDVLLERLRAHATRLPEADAEGIDAILRHLSTQRQQHRAAALEALRGDRYLALLNRLVQAASAPNTQEPEGDRLARAAVPRLVRPQWRHLEREVKALADDPPDDALHRVRIRAKRCRYAAEAAIPVIGKPAGRFAAAIEEIQTVLGDHQDAVVAEAWLREAASAVPDAAVAAGQLIARQQEERSRLRAQWRGAWKAASAKKLRHWIEGRT